MKMLGVPIGWFIGLIILMALALWFKILETGESIQIFLMFTLVLVTLQYAISTHKMAEEMRAESATRRPYLNLDNWHLPDSTNQNLWRVNLRNFGNTPAYAVQLEMKPKLSGYQGTLQAQVTCGSALIMPDQWNQWTINLGSAPEAASKQRARLEIEFVIRYRSAASKPFKAWELRLIRTPDPAISNWDLVGEDSETELISGA